MFSNDRNELRNVFFAAWKKHQDHSPIEPLEAQVIDIILLHPEYHEVLTNPEKFQAHDFTESNPFLHMSLHLALREQLGTDRPTGIRDIYEKLCRQLTDAHDAEHRMVECLGTILWEAQQSGKMPDEQAYLEKLRQI